MKKVNLLLITLLLFSFSCATDRKDTELNDTIEEANEVSLGTEFEMAIYPEGDVNWYEVQVPGQGYLEVLSRNVPGEVDMRVRFATYDEWADEKENFLTDRKRTPAAVPVYEEGEYYFKVRDRRNRNYSEEVFHVKVDFIEEFDEFEPNNDAPSASEIEFGEEYQSAIFPTGDRDWFSVEVQEQGYLSIRARNIPDDIELAAFVPTYDEYARDKVNEIKSTTRIPFDVAITEPGEYYIVFRDRRDRNKSKDLFTWRVDFLPEMDAYEPNDSFTEASEIGPDDTVEIAIFPEGDRDFFKIHPEETGTLTVESSNYGEIDLAAALHKLDPEDSNKTITVEGRTRLPASFDIRESGQPYFIELRDRRDNNASPDLFDVVFELE